MISETFESEGPTVEKPPLIQSTKSTMKMMDEIDSNLLAATSATDFMTSTPAVHRSIPPKKKPVRFYPASPFFGYNQFGNIIRIVTRII